MSEENDTITQSDAQEMLAGARTAVAEMKEELKEAKKGLAEIVSAQGGDMKNPADVARAKKTYQSTLKVHVITDGTDPKNADLMTRMYDLYAQVFPLEEEREELEKLLGMNQTKSTDAPSLEQWILLEDETGKIVGARNVLNMSAVGNPGITHSVEGTQSLVYSFVDPKYRSLGLGEFTLDIAVNEGRKFIAGTYPGKMDPDSVDMIQVAEQNAPLKLSMEAMLVDTTGAKTDQFWRREYYEGLNFRELDFGYVQVPLVPRDEGGEPGEGMNLIIRNASGTKSTRGSAPVMTDIPAAALEFYLRNYAQYVAAGGYDVLKDPTWAEQAAALAARKAAGGPVAIKPKLDFNALKDATWDFVDKYVHSKAYSEDAFRETSIGEIMGVDAIPAAKLDMAAQNGNKPQAQNRKPQVA